MNRFDLESFREVFADRRVHIAIGQIKKLMLATDRSVLRVLVSILPEEREIVARMSWAVVGEESGFFQFPRPDDLVIVGMAEDEEHSFVLLRLTTKEDKIPLRAADGHMVAKALTGKELWLTSDTKINLSKGDDAPTENLVLGQVFKSMMSDLIQLIADHTHVGNLGYATSPPQTATDFLAIKADPVDNGGVLSDIAFTEKGG